jgi:uncharacterized glyoxalase superfamily protein PhnB
LTPAEWRVVHAVKHGMTSRAIAERRGISTDAYTDDFWRDFRSYKAKGIVFVREPKEERYGTVAVFRDLYGNLWDLLQPAVDSSAMGN